MTGLWATFAGRGLSDPVELAEAGVTGGESAAGRLVNEDVGEEEEEEVVDGVGETRPAGTTSG